MMLLKRDITLCLLSSLRECFFNISQPSLCASKEKNGCINIQGKNGEECRNSLEEPYSERVSGHHGAQIHVSFYCVQLDDS